jgi:hypothetical protein
MGLDTEDLYTMGQGPGFKASPGEIFSALEVWIPDLARMAE